jgi:hypothetical protein
MPRYKMLVRSHPIAGREADYNRWYQDVHLSDVVDIPGFVAAQRFRVAEEVSGVDKPPYLAVYEIEAVDAQTAKAALISASMSGAVRMEPVIDLSRTDSAIYELFGDEVLTKTPANVETIGE